MVRLSSELQIEDRSIVFELFCHSLRLS